MTSEPRPLRVIAISQDKSLLHEISWLLEAVGYEVQTSGESNSSALWRRYSSPDFLVVDGRGVEEATSDVLELDTDNPIYRIFLYDPSKQTDFGAWYAAGAHDALRWPVSRGELLVRLRTGARYLEFERRLQRRSLRSTLPGMHSRRGFVKKLKKFGECEPLGAPQHSILATTIDWLDDITLKNGHSASKNLVNAVARAIQRAAGEGAISAYLGRGKFVTLLAGKSLSAAKSIAESLSHDFGSRESRVDGVPRPTLTSAVIPWAAEGQPDRLIQEVLETLHLAEMSGGDCVVLHGEFSKELADWQNEMSAGNPFSSVAAQDIMEPFPAILRHGAEESELALALHRAGSVVRPYVDGDGRLVGIAADRAVADSSIATSGNRADVPLEMPETIPHTASFPEIYEAFSSRGCSMLVVTAENHPLGYLTCDGFLSMIDPISVETYALTDRSPDESAYLAVTAAVGLAAAEPAQA